VGRRDLADVSSESANVGFHGFDAGEEVGVGHHRGTRGDVLDLLLLARHWRCILRGGALAVLGLC
jgi:hypothetical protein